MKYNLHSHSQIMIIKRIWTKRFWLRNETKFEHIILRWDMSMRHEKIAIIPLWVVCMIELGCELISTDAEVVSDPWVELLDGLPPIVLAEIWYDKQINQLKKLNASSFTILSVKLNTSFHTYKFVSVKYYYAIQNMNLLF